MMDVSCLNMRSQMAQLKLDISPPKVALDIKDPQVQIDSEAATVEIHRTDGKMDTDYTDWRASIGYKSLNVLAKDVAQKGSSGAAGYVADVLQEGRMMEAPQAKEAPAEFARQKNFDPWPEITLARTAPAKVTYTPGELSIDAKKGNLNIDVDPGTVKVNLDRGQVKGYVDPKQSLDMWVTKNKYDFYK